MDTPRSLTGVPVAFDLAPPREVALRSYPTLPDADRLYGVPSVTSVVKGEAPQPSLPFLLVEFEDTLRELARANDHYQRDLYIMDAVPRPGSAPGRVQGST